MEDDAVIPIDRTQVPVEYDELRDSLNRILTDLGPTPEQPKGPFGDVIESFSDGLAGKGEQINKTLNGLSEALTTLNEGRGDFFAVIKSLALFVNALYKSDQQFVALNNDLAQFTNSFTNTDRELATALQDLERSADDHPQVPRRERRGAGPRRQQPRRGDQRDPAARAAEWSWRPACTCSRTSAPTSSTSPRPTPAASSVCRSSPASPTRCSSSAARSRRAAGWGTRSPPSCVRSTWRRSWTRSSSTSCRSA